MIVLEAVRVAWLGVTGQKLRSLLTMLGIIIGVGAVIILVAAGEGSTKQVKDQIQSLGSNLILVNPQRFLGGRLDLDDISLLHEVIPQVERVAPSMTGQVKVKAEGETYDTTLEGTNETFLAVRDVKMAIGQFISLEDIQERQKVAVLGPTVVEKVFGGTMPIGETLRIGRQNFTIIGITESKGGSMGGDNDDRVWIPITTARLVLGTSRVGSFAVQVRNSQDAKAATQMITDFYNLKLRRENAVRVTSMDQILETVGSVTAVLSILLGAIASISLVVGGIGIMNIMLVSVSERTREIGIRKSLGAKRRDIMMQFLIEALILSLTGGLIGVIFGVGGARSMDGLASLRTSVTWTPVLLSFGFAAAVGIFFGLYPAIRASQLDPIEALRRE